MDKFAQAAFEQAITAAEKRELEAFKTFNKEHGKKCDMAALMECGRCDAAMMIGTVDKAGLLDTLRKYADNMLRAGFYFGYQAGHANGLEDAQ